MGNPKKYKTVLKPKTFAQRSLAALLLMVAATILIQDKLTQQSFKIYELKQTQQQLNIEQQRLQLQIAQLSSPENLNRLAQQLGMIPAENIAELNLKKQKIGPTYNLNVSGTPPL